MQGRGSHVAEAFDRGTIHKDHTVNATRVSGGLRWGSVEFDDGGDLFHESVPDVGRYVSRDAGIWDWGCSFGLSASGEKESI